MIIRDRDKKSLIIMFDNYLVNANNNFLQNIQNKVKTEKKEEEADLLIRIPSTIQKLVNTVQINAKFS